MILTQEEIKFVLVFVGILFAVGLCLSLMSSVGASKKNSVQKRLEQALPGMNCGQCGYPGCQAYAEALLAGKTTPDQCHPGGPEIAADLAGILGVENDATQNYDDILFNPRTVAYIHASECNGCGKCKKKCPVDAIKGDLKEVHKVDPEECIGCEDCIQTCPHRCIEMIRQESTIKNFNWEISSIRTSSRKK